MNKYRVVVEVFGKAPLKNSLFLSESKIGITGEIGELIENCLDKLEEGLRETKTLEDDLWDIQINIIRTE